MIAYHRPTTLAQALAIRARGPVMLLAGGTDLYPARTARLGWGDPSQPDVLDLSAIPGLDSIAHSEAGWRIGCLVTWSGLAQADLPPLFDGLRAAAREVGGAQVQNRGTLVGNLCTASPAGDGIPGLLALDAVVEIAGAQRMRALPLAQFLTGYRATALRSDEIVTGLLVPHRAGARSGFRKLGARHYLVISIAMVAGVLVCDEAGRIAEARLAVGACSAVAQRIPAMEAALLGVALPEAAGVPRPEHLAQVTPIDDIRASASFRRDAALTLLRDLLESLAA
jgi:N-methylhydantoinase B